MFRITDALGEPLAAQQFEAPDFLARDETAASTPSSDSRRNATATVTDIPLAREAKSLPLSPVTSDMPRLHLVGDKVVQREFLSQLAHEGRLHRHPTEGGAFIIKGGANTSEMATRWQAAAERVAMREDRPLVAALVHRDPPRRDWPGGAVLGAASSQRDVQRETVRAFIHDYPPNHVATVIHEAARNPELLRRKDGTIATDVIARVLDEYTRERPGQGRSASVYEVANLTAGADRLAQMLGPEHPAAAKAIEKNERLDATLLGLGGQRYADIKAAAVADIKSALDNTHERADSKPRDVPGNDSAAPVAGRSGGRDMER